MDIIGIENDNKTGLISQANSALNELFGEDAKLKYEKIAVVEKVRVLCQALSLPPFM